MPWKHGKPAERVGGPGSCFCCGLELFRFQLQEMRWHEFHNMWVQPRYSNGSFALAVQTFGTTISDLVTLRASPDSVYEPKLSWSWRCFWMCCLCSSTLISMSTTLLPLAAEPAEDLRYHFDTLWFWFNSWFYWSLYTIIIYIYDLYSTWCFLLHTLLWQQTWKERYGSLMAIIHPLVTAPQPTLLSQRGRELWQNLVKEGHEDSRSCKDLVGCLYSDISQREKVKVSIYAHTVTIQYVTI